MTPTGVGTIAVKEVATLEVTLTNTSGNDVALSSGATMMINMPSYFTDADVGKMNINYPGWTFADNDGKLTLTLSKNSNWTSGSAMSIVITNVSSSNQPPAGQQSYPGKLSLGLDGGPGDPTGHRRLVETGCGEDTEQCLVRPGDRRLGRGFGGLVRRFVQERQQDHGHPGLRLTCDRSSAAYPVLTECAAEDTGQWNAGNAGCTRFRRESPIAESAP